MENAREWESFENIADPCDGGDGQNHPERDPVWSSIILSPSKVTGTRSVLAQEVGALKIFPNPVAEGSVMVEMGNEEPALIRMFNSNGQLRCASMKTDGGKTVAFSFGNQPAGWHYPPGQSSSKMVYPKTGN
ncbi:MAG: T9SS type A sorting domain-containing protein [Haliscomenobacter sp.]|nr:T9SS type A sorting domain-containing protein [Haliscomenobacter sp.]